MKRLLSWSFIGILSLFVSAYGYWMSKAPRQHAGPLHGHTPIGAERFRLLVVGDFGSGDLNQAAVAAAMESHCIHSGADAMVLLGDNIYMDGVNSVGDPKWQTAVWQPLSSPCLGQLPIYPVLGNHDYKGSASAQIEMSQHNPRWQMPYRFYSHSFGKLLRIIAIDTNILDFCFDPSQCVLDFLQAENDRNDTRWTITLGHHPLTSASSKHPNTIQGELLKRFVCQYDAYLAGHSHHLEHRRDENCAADLFIAGAGGAKIYPPVLDQNSIFTAGEFGFLSIDVSNSGIQYQFFNEKQQLLYTTQTRQIRTVSHP